MENFNKFNLMKMYFCVFRKLSTTFFAVAATAMTVYSCHSYSSEEGRVAETAEDFGNHLFNYELKDAAAMTTDDSRKWIELLASNVDDATVELIRNQDEAATVSIGNITMSTDTTAIVEMTANNFVWANAIDDAPEVVDGMKFTLGMVKRNKKWLVRMDNLLQSGK